MSRLQKDLFTHDLNEVNSNDDSERTKEYPIFSRRLKLGTYKKASH